MNRKLFFMIGFIMITYALGINAQVYKKVFVDKAGTLISQITEDEANNVTHLVVTGKINAVDFRRLRDGFPKLQILDISNADIKMYAGKEGTSPDKFTIYQPNCIPPYAFCRVENGTVVGKASLKRVILSEKTRNIEVAAFKGCEHLTICQIIKKSAPNLSPDALADSIAAVFIPLGSRDEYKMKKNWENFAFIEGEPVEAVLQIGMQGSLREEIQSAGLQPKDINFLTIEGKLDNADLKLIQDYMPNLVSLDISKTNATVLPDFTFAQKKFLLRIKLPHELKTIGQRAFSGCGRLSGTIELPASLTAIDYGAFIGCESLKRVIATGQNLTTIGNNLFGENENKLIYTK